MKEKPFSNDDLFHWLLSGDVSIQYQVYRDLLQEERQDLRERIGEEGWGKMFLAARNTDGHWGKGFYSPKWTSTHYTLLDLKNLGIMPDNKACRESVQIILRENKGPDGGINPAKTTFYSDVCVTGMALNYCSYFGAGEALLQSLVDFLLGQHMPDGGFNCNSNSVGAVHSSMHTTLSVLEGILEFQRNGNTYRLAELLDAAASSQEFLLVHRLFRSHRTGEIIRSSFLRFHYPCRWYYDILRALDHFREAGVAYDNRMQEALDIIAAKRSRTGQWKLAAPWPGQVHFEMEKAGLPSRWNTLRGFRTLRGFIK